MVNKIKASLTIQNPNQVEKDIIKAIDRHLTSKMSGIHIRIATRTSELIREELMASSETNSILSGKLRAELGVADASSELESIFDAIAQKVKVSVKKTTSSSRGVSMHVKISAVPLDIDSIAGSLGTYTTKKGTQIPWFKWLTTLGDRVIVRDYITETGKPRVSRTGDMIMVKGKSGWRVPPEFSGTEEDNFVTRATDKILPKLGDFIRETVEGSL